MLNADTSTPNTYANMGTFGDILYRVLVEAAWRVDKRLTIKHSVFDIVEGEYPGSLLDFDVVMVTASAASSYHNRPWIRTLENYIVRLYKDLPGVKIFGSCFGHHLICQALLKEHGLRVGKSPKGWEIGINHVALTHDFRQAFVTSVRRHSTSGFDRRVGRLPSPDDDGTDGSGARFPDGSTVFEAPQMVRLQFVHEDQVIMPAMTISLPAPWVLLGSTEHCAVQGIYQPGRVLTLQGHFEFDKFESQQTRRIFGAKSGSEAEMSDSHGGDMKEEMDDGYLVAEMVIRFLCEHSGEATSNIKGLGEEHMLPTPRTSVELS